MHKALKRRLQAIEAGVVDDEHRARLLPMVLPADTPQSELERLRASTRQLVFREDDPALVDAFV